MQKGKLSHTLNDSHTVDEMFENFLNMKVCSVVRISYFQGVPVLLVS